MKKTGVILFVIVLAIGAIIRLSGLSEFPYGIWQDEAQNAIEARRILSEPGYWPVFVAGLSQMAALPFYFFAPFLALFPKGVLGLRVATTIVGVASILTTGLLANLLFGFEAALIAAALLSVMRWHMTFSQFGMAMIFTSFFIPLISYLFLRSVIERRWDFAIFAGIAMGLGLQTYYSIITLPLLLFVVWLYLVFSKQCVLGSFRSVLVFFLVSAIFYSPVLIYAFNNWVEFTHRFSTVSAASPIDILNALIDPTPESRLLLDNISESVMRHLGMFHLRGDANGRHNMPGAPMLDIGTGFLFVFGLLILIFQFFRWRSVFLFMWLGMCLAAGIFSVGFEAPQGARTFGMTPAIAIISALPLAQLLILSNRNLFMKWVSRFLVATLCTIIGYLNCNTFFVTQRYDPGVWSSFAIEATRIGEVVRDEGDGSTVYVPASLISGSTQEYLAGLDKISKMRIFSRSDDLPLRFDGKNAVIFFDPKEKDTAANIALFYPGTTFEQLSPVRIDGTRGDSVFTIARVPSTEIQNLQGWEVAYYDKTSEILTEHTNSINLDWSQFKSSPTRIVIRGILQVRKSTEVEFVIPSQIGHTITIFDEKIRGDRTLLSQGGHLIEIELLVPEGLKNTSLSLKVGGESLRPENMFLPKAFRGGLLGEYYENGSFQGPALYSRLDQQISFYFHELPLPTRPYSINWSGSINIPISGEYELGTQSKDYSSVTIDGQEILSNSQDLIYKSSSIHLTAGWHQVLITFRASGEYNQIYLYWKPPSSDEKSVIPSEYFWPRGKKTRQ